ncbi:DUF2934 domain-containing protein [Roseomonas aerophila]|uniref:DUF2934 domain-containing protein n=1 Tax=Teichococcus aerophilus TaxID=1224513 RepID=A0ABR7RR79_9PROT|nr:DUF2934 domain-containing protein [Pseudoroseomonas aerophila]MBC9208843.1 DUF2934 domain-containing protein [Pseudoroseomonas aerophila]
MQDEQQDRIRDRAHAIWEREGRPEGRHTDHWLQAEQEGSAEGVEPVASAPESPGDDAAPGTPGTGEDVCPTCQGSGRIEGKACENCGGTGIVIKGVAGG